jgi:hypothetical protein
MKTKKAPSHEGGSHQTGTNRPKDTATRRRGERFPGRALRALRDWNAGLALYLSNGGRA